MGVVMMISGASSLTARGRQGPLGAFPNLRMIAATTRVTHGVNDYSLGASLFTRSGAHEIPPIALPGAVDRIGGGDAFAGGFLYAHISGMPKQDTLAFAHSEAAKHGQLGDASRASADDIRGLMAGGALDIRC
jgi:2-dehydro-3-deoxygluconokinase